MSLICPLLLVCTSLALSSATPVGGNVGFMMEGPSMWPRDMQHQQRVRRQQGRPLRRVQPGQGRPNRRPRPQQQQQQQQERLYKQNPQQKQRPLKPVQRKPAQPPIKKVFKQKPEVERILKPFKPEQVERQEQVMIQEQEPERIPELYNKVDRSYD